MSVTPVSAGARIDIGKVFSDTFGVIQRNFGPLAISSLLAIGLPNVVSGLARLALGTSVLIFPVAIVVGLISLTLSMIFQGGVMYVADHDLNGERATLDQAMQVGLRRALLLFCVQLAVSMLSVIGFLFFIVPGVLLMLRWAVAGPVLVLEGLGIDRSMGRSAALTKDRRGTIFLLYFMAFVVVWVVEMVLMGLAGGFGGLAAMTTMAAASPTAIIMSTTVTALIGIIVGMVGTVLNATLFHHLKVSREGAASAALAEVFA